ncbi:MAG: DNA-directed DNA polymerase [Nanoarchaeota archaeon]
MKTTFIPIDYDYFDFEGRNYIKIIGRNKEGKRICVIDTCHIYLWAILEEKLSEKAVKEIREEIQKIKLNIKGRETQVEKTELHEKNFLGKKVNAIKIFATNYKDLHDIANRLDLKGIEKRRGYDLGFITHYILEKNIIPLNWHEISGEMLNNSNEFGGIDKSLDIDFCIKLESAKPLKDEKDSNDIDKTIFTPKVLAYDIEADEFRIGEGEIIMISLVSDKFKKVITCKKHEKTKKLDYVEYAESEKELLEKFVEYVKKISPDFLVGYFSDGFDLPYLKTRAEKNKIKLSLGLDDSQPRFFKGAVLTGKISGIVHIDLLKFIKTAYSQYMQSETLSLNEVANEFLGEGKKQFEIKHSSKLDENELERYYEYNLHDSVLTYGLFFKFWPDLIEFTRIMQEPIFNVSRNGMSSNVEDYIIHNLEKFNEIPERRPTYDEIGSRRKIEKYEGAFVLEPTPGLYENISLFDFTSSYGSVIVTYNLSKSTFISQEEIKKEKKKIEDSYSIKALNKEVHFSKKPGFFPEMLKEIIKKRKQYKEELKSSNLESKKEEDVLKRAKSNAFKLLANASYGYQGFFGARYYCLEAAAATAAFAKKSIKEAIEKIDKSGYKTIYSDTDSIAFLLQNKTKTQVKDFLKKLNSELPGIMELELEGFFKRGIWVTKRTGDIGAKKKYALINEEGKLKIRGFETVRRDWCKLARTLQNKVIKEVLEDGNEKRAMVSIKEVIKKIKKREIDIKQLIIKTQLKKPISEYKAISPHVIAAKKMLGKEMPIDPGALIEYYISETKTGKPGKKQLIREKVKLPDEKGEYDIEYYLNHQILPAVENIFQVFNIDIKEIANCKNQKKLCEF